MRTEEVKGDGGHGLQICPLNLQRNLASLVNWYILLHLQKVTRKVKGISSESELSSEEVLALKGLLKLGSNYPNQGNEGAAGYDVMAYQAVAVPARQIRAVDLNLACQLPRQYLMQLCSRSGLAKRGIIVIGGIIDSDYTGSIKTLIYNTTEEEYKIQKGDRIGQAFILKYPYGEFEEKELEPTGRVLVLLEINSYSINYYDCLQTNLIKKYEKATICQKN